MKINRHNYEEYFILYLDNELESEDRRQVEAFAQENPDLKAELDLLLQSKLTPDTGIAFADKESLMWLGRSSVSQTNYEEWLTSYIDDELTEEERKDIERFVAGNPAIQKELALLQQTKLQPEAIVFPHKELLYRQEEKAKVVAIRWWRIAAAAVLLIGISTTAIVLLNKKDKGSDEIVTVQSKEKKSINDTAITHPGNEALVNNQVTATTDHNKDEPIINETKIKKERPAPLKKEKPDIAKINEEKPPTNNLPKPENNPYVNGKADPNNGTTASITPTNETLTIPQENTGIVSVTPGITHTSQLTTPDDGENVEQPNGKKNKLRGCFRKVTRTFEKRTNIKATDDDDRLLIAGLAIKMN
jgi:outer membrane biosynthesis protein TonB